MIRPAALFPRIITAALFLAGLQAAGQPSQPQHVQSSQSKPAAASSAPSDAEEGQQVFARNCSRCHKAPESIPSSISGTVALHMRIRAGLSEQDYKRLLAFLNQ